MRSGRSAARPRSRGSEIRAEVASFDPTARHQIVGVALTRRRPEDDAGVIHALLEDLSGKSPHALALVRSGRTDPADIDRARAAAIGVARLVTGLHLFDLGTGVAAATLASTCVVSVAGVEDGGAAAHTRHPRSPPSAHG